MIHLLLDSFDNFKLFAGTPVYVARIWYSVCGEGMGHATRSDSVLAWLTKKHEVLITAAERSYPYLRERYGSRVHKIYGNTLVYKDNNVQYLRSFARFIRTMPYMVVANYRILRPLIGRFKPDVIISDFESASEYFSLLFGIPCINIDNNHALTELKTRFKHSFYQTCIIRFLHPWASHYIITAFAEFHARRPGRTKVVPPIIRESVLSLKPVDKDFVLIYQTSETNIRMLPVLKKTGIRYRIYGMGRKRKTGNLEFMPFSEKTFLEDLRTCRYVIINGGFTVISEALYLKKPILCIPVEKQFEQIYNAYCIKQKGYGSFAERLSLRDIRSFESNLERYRKNISRIGRWDDSLLFEHLERLIKKYA